jgi:hypothetical protein
MVARISDEEQAGVVSVILKIFSVYQQCQLVENDGSFSDMDPFVGDSWSLTR